MAGTEECPGQMYLFLTTKLNKEWIYMYNNKALVTNSPGDFHVAGYVTLAEDMHDG